jgi:ABC-type uncharacterized transport system involved in gliding motility auxiliary subunit
VRPSWLTPSFRGGVQLTLQVLLSLTLFGVLQWLATRHNLRLDLTPSQQFVLSDQAKQVAKTITAPVRVTAFYNSQQSGERRQMMDLLEQFHAASPQIDFRLMDLDRSPGLATKYGVSSYNTGVIESDGRVLTLQTIDEGEIANALLKLSRKHTRTLCFLTGHGERSPHDNNDRSGYSDVAKALERENFHIEVLDTLSVEGVSTDCTIVISAGPSHDLLPGEADGLQRYLQGGGQMFLLVDPDAPPSVLAFLGRFGVEAGNDLIVDDRNRFFGADSFMPRIPIFDEGTYRNGLEASAVLSLARTLRPRDQPTPGMRVSLIALSSPDSWALVDADKVPDEEVRFRKGVDRPGPLPVGVIVRLGESDKSPLRQAQGEGEQPAQGERGQPAGDDAAKSADAPAARGGRLIALGDSDFATNFYLNLLGNRDLFMSTVAVLSEDPELIAVRRKGLTRGTMSPISLTAMQGRVIFWIAVAAQPLLFIMIGTGVAWSRRRRQGGR